jgi:6-phosphogluconolactonase (cycloisomerase 2 family)
VTSRCRLGFALANLAATVAAIGLLTSPQAIALIGAPSGRLVQLSGTAGCTNAQGSEGCAAAPTVYSGALAIAPDDHNVYVSSALVGNQRDFVTALARDPQNGALSVLPGADGCVAQTPQPPCAPAHGLTISRDLVLSPDGRFVYVGSNNPFVPGAVAIFARDPATGALTETSCVNAQGADRCDRDPALPSVGKLVMSPDGDQVYVYVAGFFASPTIRTFDRDPATGALTRRDGPGACIAAKPTEGCTLTHGPFPNDIVVSPDGTSLVGVGDASPCFGAQCFESDGAAITVFARASDGSLIQLPGRRGCITWQRQPGCAHARSRAVGAARSLTISPDGRSVYVAAWDFAVRYDAVISLSRDPHDGTLHQLRGKAGCIARKRRVKGCAVARALSRPIAIAVSPDSRSVYVSSLFSDGVAVFRRSVNSGALTQLSGRDGCITESGRQRCARGRGLRLNTHLVVSADGRNVYGFGGGIASLVAFSRTSAAPR